MARLLGYVDLTDSAFAAAVLSIAFNPLFWNVVARWEHKTRALSRALGSPHAACYCLGTVILLLNCVRSHCFTEAMKSQPKLAGLDCHWAYFLGLAILAIGTLFVVSSFLALGFIGTFLGDYFGILMEAKVTSFPFSVLDNPMYWGSTAVYLGWALIKTSDGQALGRGNVSSDLRPSGVLGRLRGWKNQQPGPDPAGGHAAGQGTDTGEQRGPVITLKKSKQGNTPSPPHRVAITLPKRSSCDTTQLNRLLRRK